MNKRTIFLISIFLAGIATFLFYQYTNQLSQEASSTEQVKTVIAAAADIQNDQEITENMIKTVEVPADSVYPGAVTDPSKIVGQFAAAEIASGEIILDHHLQSLEESTKLEDKIQPDHRAVTLSAGAVESLANMIEPEDTIDIIYTGPSLDPKPVPGSNTVVLQANVRVLAVGRRIQTKEAFAEYDSITVEATPEEAIKFIKASKKGSLQYILHSKRKTKVEGS
ncbi:Flp pilus assembly protein CpaB [Neobacillus vireti]|uniref:Flp pilus assembly protein CpaB n=1 Tax=Neobacillus vireti TaxID=220686 RepID=UPI002FFFB393